MTQQYRVIVYGISGTLRQSIDYIKLRFSIVGFSDKNSAKANDPMCLANNYYLPQNLCKVDFDFIIITSDFDDEICDYLNIQLQIDRKKILKRSEWYRMTFQQCYGDKNPDKTFYVLSKPIRVKNGLLSNVFCFLEQMDYIEKNNYIPIVDMKSYANQYLETELVGKENSWEYYFEQLSPYSLEEVYESKNVILGYDDNCFFGKYEEQYDMNHYRYLWKKYIHLKPKMKNLIEKEYSTLFDGKKRVLGVLFRGTDMVALKLKHHAIQPTVEEMKMLIWKYLKEWNCDTIFLCTEDQVALESFKDTFEDRIFYTNQKRFTETGSQWLAQISGERKNDRYLRGEEYLTTIELLSRCDDLLAGICTGSVCALLMNDGEYEQVKMVDKGVY